LAYLYDANVWVALAFAAHPHHGIASQHFQLRDSAQPAAFCRVTQQAFLRFVSTPVIQRTFGSSLITNADAWAKCQDLLALPHVFWLDEPAGFVNQRSILAGLRQRPRLGVGDTRRFSSRSPTVGHPSPSQECGGSERATPLWTFRWHRLLRLREESKAVSPLRSATAVHTLAALWSAGGSEAPHRFG
jgi:predicted nucleic acid-binding protein